MFGTVAGELANFARVGAKAAFSFAKTPVVSVFSNKGAFMQATRAAMAAVLLLFPAVKLFRGQGLSHMQGPEGHVHPCSQVRAGASSCAPGQCAAQLRDCSSLCKASAKNIGHPPYL